MNDLFSAIARDLHTDGYSVIPNALPTAIAQDLLQELHTLSPTQFAAARVGRERELRQKGDVRNDHICWITDESNAGRQWLQWADELQAAINSRLFLGLFAFESHFAHYPKGAFYRRHVDAFAGESNRIISIVAYLNADWMPRDKGELVLYPDRGGVEGIRVSPALGTLVVFLSEEFEHEVLPAARDRYSIAGWFRVNSSTSKRVDPPF